MSGHEPRSTSSAMLEGQRNGEHDEGDEFASET
jgi:hypothetical protein